MQQNIIYVGLDVDDTQYHGSALDKKTGEVITFKCRPTLKGPLNKRNPALFRTHYPTIRPRPVWRASPPHDACYSVRTHHGNGSG